MAKLRTLMAVGVTIMSTSLFNLHYRFVQHQKEQEEQHQDLLEEDLWLSPRQMRNQRWCQAPPRYHDPTMEQKLPFLTDVFASDQGKYAYFIGYKMSLCNDDWRGQQEFHSNATHKYYFQCQFGGDSSNPDVGTSVLSEPVASQFPGHPLWSDTHFTIRCPIPHSLQRDLAKPSLTTKWTVSLYSKPNPYAPHLEALEEKNSFQKLSLCNGEWPTTQVKEMAGRNQKYQLSMMTKLNSISQVEPSHIVSWIEHHRRLGVEHFIIYDNQMDPHQHRPLSVVLARYIDQGLVTYIWYPIQDCEVKGQDHLKLSQITSTNGVLRRYAQRTKYLIHADTDEFILPTNHGQSIADVLKGFPDAESFSMETRSYGPCPGTSVTNQTKYLLFEKANCYVPNASSSSKLILRPDKVLSFFLEHPLLEIDGSKASDPVSLSSFLKLGQYRKEMAQQNPNLVQDDNSISAALERELHNATKSFLSRI